MPDLGMNGRAWALADSYTARAAELRIAVHALTSGARVIDAGVRVPGGLAAGHMLAELCMGGLGHVDFVRSPSEATRGQEFACGPIILPPLAWRLSSRLGD